MFSVDNSNPYLPDYDLTAKASKINNAGFHVFIYISIFNETRYNRIGILHIILFSLPP